MTDRRAEPFLLTPGRSPPRAPPRRRCCATGARATPSSWRSTRGSASGSSPSRAGGDPCLRAAPGQRDLHRGSHAGHHGPARGQAPHSRQRRLRQADDSHVRVSPSRVRGARGARGPAGGPGRPRRRPRPRYRHQPRGGGALRDHVRGAQSGGGGRGGGRPPRAPAPPGLDERLRGPADRRGAGALRRHGGLGQQMPRGRARHGLRYHPPDRARGGPGPVRLAVPRPPRPVGRHGEDRAVALHAAHACDRRPRPGAGRACRGRRRGGTGRAVCAQLRHPRERAPRARLRDAAPRRHPRRPSS